jgi:hypothetical protein
VIARVSETGAVSETFLKREPLVALYVTVVPSGRLDAVSDRGEKATDRGRAAAGSRS